MCVGGGGGFHSYFFKNSLSRETNSLRKMFLSQSARCLHLGSNLYVKMVDIFDANAYELGQDENIINSFTRSCRVPDETGFNYFGLYRKNFCYSFELEGASE